jgi:hypothetical protein
MDTLFAHLATRFSTHPENLATEALAYVCETSPDVRTSFLGLPALVDATVCHPHCRVSTQASGEDGSIPDLAVWDPSGNLAMLLEAKFDAELTDNQPVAYLNRLQPGRCLLFIVPQRRIDWVWSAVVRRCHEAGLAVSPAYDSPAARWAQVEGRTLGILSWTALLSRLEDAGITTQSTSAVSDLRQLQGLAERMDDQAFLPFEAAELTAAWPRRLIDLGGLIDALQERLLSDGVADVNGLRPGHGNGYYGRFIRVHGTVVFMHFSAWKWRSAAATPLWCDPGAESMSARESAFGPLERRHPQEAFRYQGQLSAPLWIKTRVGREEVVTDLAHQVRSVARLLGDILNTAI